MFEAVSVTVFIGLHFGINKTQISFLQYAQCWYHLLCSAEALGSGERELILQYKNIEPEENHSTKTATIFVFLLRSTRRAYELTCFKWLHWTRYNLIHFQHEENKSVSPDCWNQCEMKTSPLCFSSQSDYGHMSKATLAGETRTRYTFLVHTNSVQYASSYT